MGWWTFDGKDEGNSFNILDLYSLVDKDFQVKCETVGFVCTLYRGVWKLLSQKEMIRVTPGQCKFSFFENNLGNN